METRDAIPWGSETTNPRGPLAGSRVRSIHNLAEERASDCSAMSGCRDGMRCHVGIHELYTSALSQAEIRVGLFVDI